MNNKGHFEDIFVGAILTQISEYYPHPDFSTNCPNNITTFASDIIQWAELVTWLAICCGNPRKQATFTRQRLLWKVALAPCTPLLIFIPAESPA